MKIIVDYDTTPRDQRKICETLSKECQIPTEGISGLSSDDDHYKEDRRAQIAKILTLEDIVVTDDFELAQDLIENALAVVSPEGIVITQANINNLLYERYLREKNPPKALSREAAARRHHDEIDRFTTILLDLIAPLDTTYYE
jgi:uncharacterized protein YaiI (UPF0178 family)